MKKTKVGFIKTVRYFCLGGIVVLGLITIIATGGGGGGGDGGGGNENVTITGFVDDGTPNSPISNAYCVFVDLNGVQQPFAFDTANTSGYFSINVPPDKEGYIRCTPPNIPRLILSTFLSTKDRAAGDKISGENVTPTTTVVADIINSENAAVPLARKLELLNAIENEDHELNLLVNMSTILFKAMLNAQINVNLGGYPGGNGDGDNGDSGGAGGDAGDGGDFSPIPNARCDFAIDLEGKVLYSSALDDLRDGELNRPDLAAIKEEVEEKIKDLKSEIKIALDNKFPDGVGLPYVDIADENGRYFLPIPPNVQGYVRCSPPDQPKLKLATLVPKLQEGEVKNDQDVTPATTFFSHSIASELSGDLDTVKENYLDDIAGLEDIQIIKDGETITNFVLKGDPKDKDVGLVAFSATSLFNILYKNEMDVDYLAALDGLIDNWEVRSEDLKKLGIPEEDAEEWSGVVNESNDDAGVYLDTNLEKALSTARIKVKVTDRPGGDGISGAKVKITDAPGVDGWECDTIECETDTAGEVTLTLTGVPETEGVQIEVEASSVAGFETTTRTTQVVAFATVDLEIPFSYNLTVQGDGTGSGTVTSFLSGISCDISEGHASGDYSEGYEFGAEVTLTAEPLEDSTFDGWSGGVCSGTGDCTVTMNQAHTVIATFTLKATPCTYSISPVNRSFPPAGGTGSIDVSASASDCSWTASESVGWITITSGSSGIGDGAVRYTVSSNTGTSTRSADITVAGRSHRVTQMAPCTYSINPTSRSFTADGDTGSISVTSPSGCSWTASESVDWITITSGSSGSGDGTVSYTVSANTGTSARSAVITVAEKSHTVTQEKIPDINAPTITITTPTSGTTYETGNSTLNIGGSASDDVGVTQVTWANSRGGSGTCSGTTSWSQSGISLYSGTNVITVTARDAAGNTGSDTLTVTMVTDIDYPNRVVKTIPMASYAEDLAVTPDGGYVYVVVGATLVSVIRTTDNTLLKETIRVGWEPEDLAVTPDGGYVYVTNQGGDTVSVIRTTDNEVVDTIRVGNGPNGVAVTPDGGYVYVANQYYDGTVSVIRTTDNRVVNTISVGGGPSGVAVTPDGNYVYVTNQADDTVSVIRTSDNKVETIPVGDLPYGVAVTPDGGYVYVTNQADDTVSVIRTSDNKVETIPVGDWPYSVAVTPDGGYVYVTGTNTGKVSVIRTTDNKVVNTIPMGENSPWDVAVTPDGGYVYVGCQNGVRIIGF